MLFISMLFPLGYLSTAGLVYAHYNESSTDELRVSSTASVVHVTYNQSSTEQLPASSTSLSSTLVDHSQTSTDELRGTPTGYYTPTRPLIPPIATIRPPSQPSHPATPKKNPKRGIAFASKFPGDIRNANQSASVISWQYNWANIPPAYLATSGIPFVPMQWGGGAIESFVDAVRMQGSKVILGFNEPDLANEANMDPGQAAALWVRYIEPLKQHGVRLGGPAVTGAATGQPWLRQFFEACAGRCTVDFLPIHWYGVGFDGFYGHLWSVHQEFPQYPIWVTEYADLSLQDAEVYNFMEGTMRYMDELDWVEKYAWFGFFRPEPNVRYNMLHSDGGLNALGELYVGAKTVHKEVIADGSLVTYNSVNGADVPGQPLVTAWPENTRFKSSAAGSSGAGFGLAVAIVLSGSIVLYIF